MEEVFQLLKVINKSSLERKILMKIMETNSLTATAQQLNISYKTVWNYVTRLNNLSNKKLIETKIGGKGGGAAYITEHGKTFLNLSEDISKNLTRLLSLWDNDKLDSKLLSKITKRYTLKTSARNQIPATVVDIENNDLTVLIKAQTKEQELIKAQLTLESLKALGIDKGTEVFLLVKAPWIAIAVDEKQNNSMMNSIPARINEIIKGKSTCEIIMESNKGLEIVSSINIELLYKLKIETGARVFANFESSNVIIGI